MPPSTALLQSSSPSDVSQALSDYPSVTKEQFHTLHTRSRAAKATAYCPYSQFRVGATALTSEGVFVDGANVENAAYPVGTCAERVCLGKGVVDGDIGVDRSYDKSVGDGEGSEKKKKGGKVVALAVATDISPPASPYGMCRQL